MTGMIGRLMSIGYSGGIVTLIFETHLNKEVDVAIDKGEQSETEAAISEYVKAIMKSGLLVKPVDENSKLRPYYMSLEEYNQIATKLIIGNYYIVDISIKESE